MMRKLVWLMAIALLCGWGAPAHATGGIYPATGDERFSVESLKVTYALDSTTDTVTAIYNLTYWGRIEQFLWLMPVPDSDVQVEYIPRIESRIHHAIELPHMFYLPTFDTASNYCSRLYNDDYLYMTYFGEPEYAYGVPSPTETQVINGEDVLDWLEDADYPISEMEINTIEKYIAQGMSFVTLDMAESRRDGFIYKTAMQLKLTYHDETTRFSMPLQLLLTQPQAFDFQVNILGDTRYTSENFPETSIKLNDLRIRHEIALTDKYIVGDFLGIPTGNNYQTLRLEALAEVNWQGFVTQLAMPMTLLLANTAQTGISTTLFERISDSIGSYQYLTRMYGHIETDGSLSLPDPQFIPLPDALVVQFRVDATAVDALSIWGCSTRTIENSGYEAIAPHLPTGRTGIYAHPEGWQAYEFIYDDGSTRHEISLIAPEPVGLETLEAYLKGETTPPMLLIYPEDYALSQYYSADNFNFPEGSTLPRYGGNSPMGMYRSEILGILTTEADFAANEAMYRAMVDFPLTFQYRLHSNLRHTLFLKPYTTCCNNPIPLDSNILSLAIGYPEGWIERMPIPQHVFIVSEEFNTPETFQDPSDVPYVWIRPVNELASRLAETSWDERQDIAAALMGEQFGVNEADFMARYPNWCGIAEPFMPFEQNGRQGFIAITFQSEDMFLLEISAPVDEYNKYQNVLETILESARPIYMCG